MYVRNKCSASKKVSNLMFSIVVMKHQTEIYANEKGVFLQKAKIVSIISESNHGNEDKLRNEIEHLKKKVEELSKRVEELEL